MSENFMPDYFSCCKSILNLFVEKGGGGVYLSRGLGLQLCRYQLYFCSILCSFEHVAFVLLSIIRIKKRL